VYGVYGRYTDRRENSMNTQHTPGPWYTSPDAVPDWHVQVTVSSEATGERVATVFQTEANAQLIAAAPDLLAICKRVLDEVAWSTVRTATGFDRPEDLLSEVIAKATGR
jgi:hypothetical protein